MHCTTKSFDDFIYTSSLDGLESSQVHDEVMLEGPAELAAEAKAEVVACMERPFDDALPSLLVDLVVDAKTATTWYEAK